MTCVLRDFVVEKNKITKTLKHKEVFFYMNRINNYNYKNLVSFVTSW